MIAVLAVGGLLLGLLLDRATDFLPRFAAEGPAAPAQGSWRWLHLALPLASAAGLPLLWTQFGQGWAFVLAAGSFAVLLLITAIDLKYRLVLNVVTYPALVAVLVGHLVAGVLPIRNVLLGGALTFAIFYLTAWLRPGDLGMGDVKLAALIGFAFGFPNVLWALLVGAGVGAAVTVYLLVIQQRGRKSTIPYAPFLCLGALVALLYNPLLAGGNLF